MSLADSSSSGKAQLSSMVHVSMLGVCSSTSRSLSWEGKTAPQSSTAMC